MNARSLLCLAVTSLLCTRLLAAAPTAAERDIASATKPSELVWLESVKAGLEDARQTKRPLLVNVGAEWCGWCKKLDEEIEKPAVQKTLKNWTLVRLDADKDIADARKLAVGPIPALRILSGNGRTVASHDGFLDGDALVAWLNDSYKRALAASEVLLDEPKSPAEAQAMVDLLTDKDALVREAAIHLLLRRPDLAAPKAVEAFANNALAGRLAILELLNEWKAPLDGMDPWEPATVTPKRIEALKQWSAGLKPKASTTGPTTTPRAHPKSSASGTRLSAELSADALAAAKRDIVLLLAAGSAVEARAVRERLARIGPALRPEVSVALAAANNDDERERLNALRYRLATSDTLAAAWPEGIERLGSLNAETRHRAADELATKATSNDGALLLELFADPDPFVRETSLRLLQSVGGQLASANLIQLLHDPEPNVRAAVLKQLAAAPARGMDAEVIKFVQAEKDPDLVVHAVRVLRESKTKSAADALSALLPHDSWRVRAEAAESLGKLLENTHGAGGAGISDEQRADIYAAMIKLLDDSDGFVVSRAVLVLRDANMSAAFEPLVEAANRRPELAPDVVRALSQGQAGGAALKYLRQFCKHANPLVRAAAIRGLVATTPLPSSVVAEIKAALQDEMPAVRVAAMAAVVDALEKLRPDPDDEVSTGFLVFGGNKKKQRDMEAWLANFRTSGQAKWLSELSEILDRILAGGAPGDSAASAVAAATPLAAMGRDAKALPVLNAAVNGDSPSRRAAARALPWLAWEQRASLFKALLAKADREELAECVREFSKIPTPASADLLWNALASPAADAALANAVRDALRRVYLGNRSYDRSAASEPKRQVLLQAAQAKLSGGSDFQRLAAMALLIEQSPKDVIEPAERLVKERPATDPLKVDAFQVLLLAKRQASAKDADSLALTALTGDAPYEMKKIALKHFCLTGSELSSLRNAIWLNISFTAEDIVSGEANRSVTITPPEGLNVETIRPMLKDEDKVIAACAGYLVCLFGDRSGLDPLLTVWRASPSESELCRLVYRAVATLGDDNLTPVLHEVYNSMGEARQYYAREFYWTIRSIKGEKILKLRKQIRDEVGMQQLQ